MHAGLLHGDSIVAPAHDEAAQVAAECIEMPEVFFACAGAAQVFYYASAWAWEVRLQVRDFSSFRLGSEPPAPCSGWA
ncbi:MAG: hypothetical protein ABIR04_02390 [Cypionkella sp.]